MLEEIKNGGPLPQLIVWVNIGRGVSDILNHLLFQNLLSSSNGCYELLDTY
jgi:hypothetical protein